MPGPADVPDLAFHLRADTGLYQDDAGTTPATSDAHPVGRWEDQSGNGHHLTQATSGNRPTLELDSAFKGEPAVRFVGSSTQWLSSPTFQETSGATAGTWFLCFQSDGTGTSALVSPVGDALAVVDDNGALFLYHHSGAGEYGYHSFYRPTIGKCSLLTYDSTGADNAGRIRVRSNTYDRTLVYSGSPISATAFTVAAGLTAGKFSGGASGYATARLLEVAYWPRVLTTGERDDLESHARTRYFGHGRGNVHCVGDSLTRGYPAATLGVNDWPTQLDNLLGAGWAAQNNGQIAYSIAQLLATFAPTVDIDRDEWRDAANGGLGDFVISQGGTNNLYPAPSGNWRHDADQTLAEQVASVAHWKGLGFTVLVTTIPPVGSTGPGGDISPEAEAIYNAEAADYAAMVLAGGSGADIVIDWHTGEFSDPYDPVYFYSGDRIHFEAALDTEAAERAHAAITGGTPPPPPPPPPPSGTTLVTPIYSANGGILFLYVP